MKKSFFKKLSFVLALAMIVSVIGPATGAFAATKTPKINAATKVLTIGQVKEYDFSVANKIKGSKYAWSSSNKAVATVDSKGLTTAIAPGTADITVKVSATVKGKKKTYTSKSVVTVKDNFKSLTVAPADEKFAVDTEKAFKATGTTYSGATESSTAKIYWTVTGKDGAATTDATISDAGAFKATKPGEYTVTAKAFQSATAHDNKSDATASADYKVTVKAAVKATAQTDADTFTVTFDSDMSKTDIAKDKVAVYQIINGKQVSTGTEKIKTFGLDSTGKVATIDMYAAFNQKAEYNFVYGDLVGKFTAAEVSLAKITDIAFADTNVDVEAPAGTSLLGSVTAKNADGVVIYTGTNSDFGGKLTFTYGGDYAKGSLSGSTAFVYTEKYVAPVTVKYSNFTYDDAQKKYVEATFTKTANITGTKTDKNINTSSIQYFVSKTAPSTTTDWTKVAFTIPAGDPAQTIYARFKTNNDANNYVNATTEFTYTSSNTDKAIINGTTLIPLVQGNVTVIVKKAADGTVVGTFDVAVQASRSFAGLTQEQSNVVVGNNSNYGETGTIGLIAKDSMNDAINVTVPVSAIEVTNFPSGSSAAALHFATSTDATSNKVTISVDAKGALAGAYQCKAKVSAYGTDQYAVFTVSVGESNKANDPSTTAVNYAVVLGTGSVDVKASTAVNNNSVAVYGLNSAGLRVSQLSDAAYTVDLTLNGAGVSGVVTDGATAATTGTSIAIVRNDNNVLKALASGTYNVTVKAVTVPNRTAGNPFASAQFTVNDTTTKDIEVKTTAVAKSGNNYDDAVKAAFTFKLNGTDVTTMTSATITNYKVSVGSGVAADTTAAAAATATFGASDNSLFIASVTVEVNNGTTVSQYTFDVNKTIALQ